MNCSTVITYHRSSKSATGQMTTVENFAIITPLNTRNVHFVSFFGIPDVCILALMQQVIKGKPFYITYFRKMAEQLEWGSLSFTVSLSERSMNFRTGKMF
jgi:hypothetical protein